MHVVGGERIREERTGRSRQRKIVVVVIREQGAAEGIGSDVSESLVSGENLLVAIDVHHALGELDGPQPQWRANFKRKWAVETDREGRDGFVTELVKSLGKLLIESQGFGQASNGGDPVLHVRLFDEGKDAGHVHHVSCEFVIVTDNLAGPGDRNRGGIRVEGRLKEVVRERLKRLEVNLMEGESIVVRGDLFQDREDRGGLFTTDGEDLLQG